MRRLLILNTILLRMTRKHHIFSIFKMRWKYYLLLFIIQYVRILLFITVSFIISFLIIHLIVGLISLISLSFSSCLLLGKYIIHKVNILPKNIRTMHIRNWRKCMALVTGCSSGGRGTWAWATRCCSGYIWTSSRTIRGWWGGGGPKKYLIGGHAWGIDGKNLYSICGDGGAARCCCESR